MFGHEPKNSLSPSQGLFKSRNSALGGGGAVK